MAMATHVVAVVDVALRKESVDRNSSAGADANKGFLSLSARRAWIEILCKVLHFKVRYVALRKESVDRNKSKKG